MTDAAVDAHAMADVTTPGLPRSASFTGLRGVGCLLVVFGHAWTIVPADTLARTGRLYGFFRSGSLGVTVFMVLGSFLVTRSLVAQAERTGAIGVDRFWMRRLVRVGAQLFLLLIVLWVVSWFDRTDVWNAEQHERSLLAAGTFTLNWVLVDNPTGVRDDLGHLWYLSIEQQFYFVWLFVLAWFGRFRVALIAGLAASATAVFVWRFHVIDDQGTWVAGLRTSTRADGLLLGAAAALAYPVIRRWTTAARWISVPCLVTLTYLVYRSATLDEYAYLKAQGIIFAVAAAMLVLAIAVARHPRGPAEWLLSVPPLVFIGRISFPLFLWHYPVFWASSRWGGLTDWFPRAVWSCVALAGIVFVTYRWVEVPITRWLSGVRREGGAAGEVATRTEIAAAS